EPETRDAWWTELRKEIRSHIRALGCNVVLGYMETTNISDEICVLSASGTAAVLSTSDHELMHLNTPPILSSSFQPRPSVITTAVLPENEKLKDISKDKEKPLRIDVNLANQVKQTHSHECMDDPNKHLGCRLCHIPYSESSVPFPINLARCNVCRKGKVPDVLFMTIEPPPSILVNGKSCLLQARVWMGSIRSSSWSTDLGMYLGALAITQSTLFCSLWSLFRWLLPAEPQMAQPYVSMGLR
ncbi:c2 domain-containing protein 5, partial [Trichonephila clavipes]